MRGALWLLGADAWMSVQSATIKWLGADVPSLEIVFFRCLFGLGLVIPLLMREGGLRYTAARLPLHLARAAFGLGSMACAFYAYTVLPLAEAIALTFTMPLFLTVLAALVLRETVGWRRRFATLAGFAGVLLVLRPGAHALQAAALFALAAALLQASVSIVIKRLAAVETSGMIILYFNLAGVVVFALPAAHVWVPPTGTALVLMAAIAMTGMASQFSLINACRVAEMSAIAPVDYSRLLFGGLLGYLLFAEVPDRWSIAGAAVIVVSTLYIARREIQLARRARRAASMSRLAVPHGGGAGLDTPDP